MALRLTINGVIRDFAELAPGVTLAELVTTLGLKPDRVAVEWNGKIARRESWGSVVLGEGDKLEVVHFVGGGLDAFNRVRHCT